MGRTATGVENSQTTYFNNLHHDRAICILSISVSVCVVNLTAKRRGGGQHSCVLS